MVETPSTAPGSTTIIPRTIYRHSRRTDPTNIGNPPGHCKPQPAMTPPVAGGRNGHATLPHPRSRDRRSADRSRVDPPGHRAGAGSHAVPCHAGAGSRLRPRDRLHGRRRGRGAGRPRVVRPRHQARQRGCRADPLPDAPPPLHAVRDVRDQVPREAADLRGTAVDPPPHRQRERVLRPLLRHGPGVLHPRARAPGRAIRQQPPGPRRRARGRGGRRGAGPAARRRRAGPTTTTPGC